MKPLHVFAMATTVALALTPIASAPAFAQAAAQGSAPTAGSSAASAAGMAGGSKPGNAGAASRSDTAFVVAAAKGGMAEVALGEMAQQRGGSEAVKQFGARMVADHGKANEELMKLAWAKGIAMPPAAPPDAKAQKLAGLSGTGFDRAYNAAMLADHKKAVALFEKQSRSSGGDPDVKAFAVKTLPTLKMHLQMLQADRSGGAASGGMMR